MSAVASAFLRQSYEKQCVTLVHFQSTIFPHAPNREGIENEFAISETKYSGEIFYFGCVSRIFLTKFLVRYRTSSGFTDRLVTADGCRGVVKTSSIMFKVRPGDDDR